MSTDTQTAAVDPSARFAFGANWARFLRDLNDERIELAASSLTAMVQRDSLNGVTFLDIGSGSGLFSLAARRLGATVRSFDYDPLSVNCTAELRRRYFPAALRVRSVVRDSPIERAQVHGPAPADGGDSTLDRQAATAARHEPEARHRRLDGRHAV